MAAAVAAGHDPTVPLDVARVTLERFQAHVIHCIATHSFCVLRVSPDVAATFCEATEVARRFFDAVPEVRKLATRELYQEVACSSSQTRGAGATAPLRAPAQQHPPPPVAEAKCDGAPGYSSRRKGKRKAGQLDETGQRRGAAAGVKNDTAAGLWGYSTPTSAKQLFRMRRGPVCQWPTRPRKFKAAMLTAMGHLEDLNHAVLSVVLAGVAAVSREDAVHNCHAHGTGGRGPSADGIGDACHAPPACSCHTARQLDADSLLRAYTSVEHLPVDGGAYLHSPFDAFLYHNSHHKLGRATGDTATTAGADDTVPSPNCLAHVDPGFLSCIPVAETPGLMIMDASTREWVDVEALRGVTPLRDVVIFSGWSLQVASEHRVPAAVHLVRSAPAPRLSLVYERRQEDGGDGWDMPSARTKAAAPS